MATASGTEPWPLLGRDVELRRLEDAFDKAAQGQAAFAVVTGEPGIGKSRLCADLAAYARDRGATVLTGRCSQDEGAPPLWPWSTILNQLGRELPTVEGTTGSEFRLWEAITCAVRDAATADDGPLVLVLDDLHWADSATLRVMRLLAETVQVEPLLVLATWRDRPRPTGPLADVAETFGRRHANRVELSGLDVAAVAGIVDAVTGRRPSDQQARALRARTDGNPFFLVEYALLAGVRKSLGALLAESDPPTAVQEVLGRRLDRLPAATVEALRTAAVAGREFDVALLAAVSGADGEDLLDVVEPAVAAGLVRDDGVDRFQFGHALVRDTLYAGLSPSRRARRHAKIAAYAEESGAPETEVARHWLAAGPACSAQAWRSAAAAARVTMRAHAYREAVDLFRAALTAVAEDSAATTRDRYAILVGLAGAYRRAVMWRELVRTVEEAVAAAEQLGDPVLAAEAAAMTAQGALWQSAAHGQVHTGIVTALRRSLMALPPRDSPLRCRCMLSLAQELYYAIGFHERRALVDEALSMARRLGDPVLMLDACHIGYGAIWAPATAAERLQLAEQALDLARQLGDEHAEVTAATFQAIVLGELGRPAELAERYVRAKEQAGRIRHLYGLIVLDSMIISWRALQGRFAEADALLGSVMALASSASLVHLQDAVRGNLLTVALWRGSLAVTDDVVANLAAIPFPSTAAIGFYLWRSGREEDARRYIVEHGVDLAPEDWFSMLNWCYAGAMAAYLPDPELGAAVYTRLAPYAGRNCSAGSGAASGPVDGYLALAALAAGEHRLAAGHADEAQRRAGYGFNSFAWESGSDEAPLQ